MTWADLIQIEDAGKYIQLAGANTNKMQSEGLLARYAAYLKPVPIPAPTDDEVSRMPHLCFANASERDELLRFVRKFGPVVADDPDEPCTTVVEAGDTKRSKTTIEAPVVTTWVGAIQRWDELQREQSLFQSLLLLIQAVKSGDADELRGSLALFEDVLSGTFAWIEQHSRESLQRERNGRSPIDWNWSRTQQEILANLLNCAASVLKEDPKVDGLSMLLACGDPFYNVHRALCEVLNAFPPVIQYLLTKQKDRKGEYIPLPVEIPRSDLTFGIRPVLYFMLRTDYLRGWDLRMCRRQGCGVWFRPTGKVPHHCTPQCARKHRQGQYWNSKGSNKRRARIEQKMRSKKTITAKRKNSPKIKA
jgi:hypothetical protein